MTNPLFPIKSIASSDQINFGFTFLIIVEAFAVLFYFINIDPLLLRLIQALYISAAALLFTGFIKNRHYYFSGKDEKYITSIKMTRRNCGLVKSAIELTRSKSENIREFTSDSPFPETKPAFENTEYDIPNYFNKTTEMFYENELIGYKKNMFSKNVYSVKYHALNGKIYRGKQSNSSWDIVVWATIVLSSVVIVIDITSDLFSKNIFLLIMAVLGILLTTSFLLQYVKHEVVGLYDKNKNVAYWQWVTKSNREQVEKIIEFIQSKIPTENKA